MEILLLSTHIRRCNVNCCKNNFVSLTSFEFSTQLTDVSQYPKGYWAPSQCQCSQGLNGLLAKSRNQQVVLEWDDKEHPGNWALVTMNQRRAGSKHSSLVESIEAIACPRRPHGTGFNCLRLSESF